MGTPALGSELAGYRIDGLIGRGGMGVVYRATDVRLGRRVALKLIAAERAGEPEIRERFQREARLMAAIDHPNVVPVYAAGEDEGCLYLVMRFVAGTDLSALVSRRGRLVAAEAVRITEQVASALDAAHAAGLVHRDIKPANVLLAGDHVYLTDFGLGRAIEATTRLTDSNDWLGTVDFCAPEQLRCEPVDARTDVYSLGCLLHTLLTGTPPHHRDTAAATMLAQLNDEPRPPSATAGVAPAFDPVLRSALAKRPADRFASAGELARAARTALGAPGMTASGAETRVHLRGRDDATAVGHTRKLPGPPGTKLDLRQRRTRAGTARPSRRVILLLIGLIVALAGAVAALSSGSRPVPPGPLSQAEIGGLAQTFARDYGRRDAGALASLLTPGVSRVSPSGTEHGQPAVAAVYRSELSDGSIVGYRLTDLQLAPGWIGRANARYEILRIGRPTITGRVTFGVERIGRRARIGLIVAQPG